MAITFIPKTNTKEVEVEGYGTVKIRAYGAGEELQIAKNMRELEELQNQAEAFLEEVKQKYGNDQSKLSSAEKTRFEKIQRKVNELTNELHEIIRSTISSDDPKVAKRLFKELPLEEIRRLVTMAMEDDAEA